LDWNGNSGQPLNYYASDVASLRAMGGDVIPSFGGYSADHGGTEIADSCTNVQAIAADRLRGPAGAGSYPAGLPDTQARCRLLQGCAARVLAPPGRATTLAK
jgi:hypothetical protein